jgi:hypothetical protein
MLAILVVNFTAVAIAAPPGLQGTDCIYCMHDIVRMHHGRLILILIILLAIAIGAS